MGPSGTGTSLPDWVRCINCYVQASGGRINHRRGCPDHVPVTRRALQKATTVRLGDLLKR